MHTSVAIRELEKKPRKMMCPEFATCIIQHTVASRIGRAVRLRLITLRYNLRKLIRVMLVSHKLSALIKQCSIYLFDFLMLTHFRVSKGCALERVTSIMVTDVEHFRRIKCKVNITLL